MWLHLCFEVGLKDRASVESKEKTQPTHIKWSRSQTAAKRASHPEAEGWPPDKSWERAGRASRSVPIAARGFQACCVEYKGAPQDRQRQMQARIEKAAQARSQK